MKTLLLIMLLAITTTACPTATIYGDIIGKSDIGDAVILRGVKRVLFVRDTGEIYAAPVVRGHYSIDLERCGQYEVSALTIQNYYFNTVLIDLTQTSGFEMNIYGLRRQLTLDDFVLTRLRKTFKVKTVDYR